MPENNSGPKRTSIREILTSIRQRLIDKEVLPAARIALIARDTDPLPDLQAPAVIYLRPRGFDVDEGMALAGGRVTTMLRRLIDVIPRVRRNLDKIGSDLQWLTDETLSYFKVEEDALNALQIKSLLDEEGLLLLCEPMRVVNSDRPKKDRGTRNPGWGDGAFALEVKYLADLDTMLDDE